MLAALALLVTVCAGFSPGVSVASSDAPAASPSPKNDPCKSQTSKWAHLQCEEFNSSAPGDEYFGRMKLSYLGIDNTFKDGVISAGAYTTDPRVISKLNFADEALRKWADKYPNDPQLARSYFLGVQVYRKVYTEQGQETTWYYITQLTHKYSKTYFGKTMTASLKKNGYTEHFFADPQACPPPPSPGQKPSPSPAPAVQPTAFPGASGVIVYQAPCQTDTPPPMPWPIQTP
jgi:hypothetical protein